MEDYVMLQKALGTSLERTILFCENVRKYCRPLKPTIDEIRTAFNELTGTMPTPRDVAQRVLIDRHEAKVKKTNNYYQRTLSKRENFKEQKKNTENTDKYDGDRYANDPRDYKGISRPI